MHINIQGHGIELTPPLKEYAEKKIGKLDEFFNKIIKAEIVLDARKIKSSEKCHVAEVNLWVGGKKVISATEAGRDMYAAIDLVVEELKPQLKKHKGKHNKEKRREGEKIKRLSREYNPEVGLSEDEQAIEKARCEIKNMTREEAKAELKLLKQDFIVFRNVENAEITMLSGRSFVDSSSANELNRDDAAKSIKKGSKKVLAFINPETNQLNVLYKRNSGNFGLIEPC